MSAEDSHDKPKIKVNDRRRFTESGEEKEQHAAPSKGHQESQSSSHNTAQSKSSGQQTEPDQSLVGGEEAADSGLLDRSGQPLTSNAEKPGLQSEGRQADNDPAGQQAQDGQINFMSFVTSLATQALMQLGQMQVPDGYDLPVDKQAARQTIDLLTILQVKTKGNLETHEKQVLDEIVHTLKMSFSQA